MKILLAICMIASTSVVWAGEMAAQNPNAVSVVMGKVLEVRDVENYTYLHLKTRDGETWTAVDKSMVKKGDTVTIENVTVMSDFKSKTLNKTFPTILFGTLGNTAAGGKSGHFMGAAYPVFGPPQKTGDANVKKAVGPNARTVAEITSKAAELKGKAVLLRGKVVKYNPGIMGRNWIHLRDGSGSAADNTNDILVTSTNPAKLGDIVTAKGTVRTDKDFGAGYAYDVLIEEATLQ